MAVSTRQDGSRWRKVCTMESRRSHLISALSRPSTILAVSKAFPLPQTWNITIRGPHGEREPIFTDERVAFNGDEETGNACEPFIINLSELFQSHFFACCKTGHCAYDLLVIAALVRFAHYFPTVVLWSDGEEAGLDAGAKLCCKAFGVGVNPLRDPAYYAYVDTTIASWQDG